MEILGACPPSALIRCSLPIFNKMFTTAKATRQAMVTLKADRYESKACSIFDGCRKRNVNVTQMGFGNRVKWWTDIWDMVKPISQKFRKNYQVIDQLSSGKTRISRQLRKNGLGRTKLSRLQLTSRGIPSPFQISCKSSVGNSSPIDQMGRAIFQPVPF